ncbi:SDR family NAD(P)-dependent oxidoreductase [Paenibacillus sp. BC26]|uniref:SDR family NAD(P)-dependent oxidoreductase n=1 Tax=Paenibacillus sp. BC26 TaxID=1881032 RepID=UPI0008F1DA52|nr:SDR family NAD(P)-dependent oxidoreductase [Paenibacillus sp. BC26]SFT14544.1 3-oxoacyl-[acyl-carrier protein] reductase [Paenibacillus sp. BC26]
MEKAGRFESKVALITGGATGVGYATACRLGSEGAIVVISGRRSDVGEHAAAALVEQGYRASFIACDVSDEAAVAAMFAQVEGEFGQLDILVNNAATFEPMRFLGAEMKDWRKVFDIIVDGTFHCTQAAARMMTAKGTRGSIINVSSINGSRALEESSSYNAAKGAMDQLTRNTALELIDAGIRVNSVALGFIETPMSVVDGVKEHETAWFQDIYVARGKIAQRRQGQPEEVAGVIAFLASEDASYMCGAVIPVDGGLSITF